MILITEIHNSLIQDIKKTEGVSSYSLTDDSITNKCNPVSVKAANPFYVLKFDGVYCNGSRLDIYPFFQNLPKLKKCSDFIILYFRDNIYQVFLCELKSNNLSGYQAQLDASYILSEFLVSTAKRTLNDYTPKVKYKGIVFTNRVHKIYQVSRAISKTNRNLIYFERSCGAPFDLDYHCY